MAEVEREFAATVAEKGMRDGFLEYIADNGILFAPGAVNGREYYLARERRPGLLSWAPEFSEVTCSDLGWTTGHWEFRRDPTMESAAAIGHYITIWRKQTDDSWKFVLDIGVSYDSQYTRPAELTASSTVCHHVEGDVSSSDAADDLREFERQFSTDCSTNGAAAAYRARISEDVRLYRDGIQPLVGAEAALSRLSTENNAGEWRVTDAGVSACGSLGYTYGIDALSDSAGEFFSFTRIWRRGARGGWFLALEVQIPRPAPFEK
ncbi:MAG TPA: hypothetical protein VLB27_04365 [candidate division Zixibacteria bacterium]|nr:hypothetical protein [candidate division Zixibacteria bacterium]